MNINEKAIREGMAKANAIIEQRINAALYRLGMYYLQHAIDNKEYSNLTGNTITSTSFGLYKDYQLQQVIFISMKEAIRTKLIKGEWFDEPFDYDGNVRSFQGKIDTDAAYGKDLARDFLMQYRPLKPNAIVLTTGTEYSTYIENELDSNVLTQTRDEAKNTMIQMFNKNFERIK